MEYFTIGFVGSYMVKAENDCEAWKLYEKMKVCLPVELELKDEELLDL